VLVGKDFEYQLIKTDDLPEYVSGVRKVQIMERQAITCRAPFSLVEFLLTQLYGRKHVSREGKDTLLVMNDFRVFQVGKDAYIVEWNGNPMNDLVADSIVMLLLGAESSRVAVKATKGSGHSHSDDSHAGIEHSIIPTIDKHQQIVKNYLESYYGVMSESAVDDEAVYQFTIGEHPVIVSRSDYSVQCTDRDTFDRVTETLHNVVAMLDPDFII
jgi:cleavage and polyadenylation specificity factor subunit 3